MTSFSGLLKFSVEKAYTVITFVPNSLHKSTISSILSAPSWCPLSMSIFISLANLLFPSIIMAIWRGALNFLTSARRFFSLNFSISLSKNLKKVLENMFFAMGLNMSKSIIFLSRRTYLFITWCFFIIVPLSFCPAIL